MLCPERWSGAWLARWLASASIIDYEIAADKANERLDPVFSLALSEPRVGWLSAAVLVRRVQVRRAGWLSDYRMTGTRQCACARVCATPEHARDPGVCVPPTYTIPLSRHPFALYHHHGGSFRCNTPFYTAQHPARSLCQILCPHHFIHLWRFIQSRARDECIVIPICPPRVFCFRRFLFPWGMSRVGKNFLFVTPRGVWDFVFLFF